MSDADRRSRAGLAWIAALALGCAGPAAEAPAGTTAPAPESWVHEAETLEASGCKCPDDKCLSQTRSSFDALYARYGGSDEAPLEVHAARGRFDACYRRGTFDHVRDVELATKQLCACSDVKCVKRALAESERVTNKYQSAATDPKDADKLQKLQAQFDKCRAERVVDGAAWLVEMESLADAACACADQACAVSASLRLAERLGGTIVENLDGEAAARLNEAYGRMCKCSIKAGLVGASGSAQCHVSETGVKVRVELRR